MKIVRFRDSYFRRDGKNNRFHFYGIFRNKKKKNIAIALTHISRPDYSRERKVEKGILGHIRLKALNRYSDSGITHYIYSTDSFGKEIDVKKGEIVADKVSSSSASKIKKFAFSKPEYVSYKKSHVR